MDFFETILSRKSVRSFKNAQVGEHLIEKILDAARLAPTARNIQPLEFVVVRDLRARQELARLASANAPFFSQAAVVVAVLSQKTKYYLEDGCAATTQALLACTALGLGACWVAADKKDYADAVRVMLHVPDDFYLVSLFAFGYPERSEQKAPEKKKLKEMIHWEVF